MESLKSSGAGPGSGMDAVIALPILIFVLLAILLKASGLDNTFVFDPPELLLMLNAVFLFGCPMLVVYLAGKGYLASGSVRMMTLESGVLTFATGSLLAGFMLPWKGPNAVVTIHNCSVMLSGLIQLYGGVLTLAGVRVNQDVRRRVPKFLRVNLGILMVLFILAFGAFQEKLPVFFVQGQGPTLLRQIVLGIAFSSFLISGFLFLKRYRDSRSRFFYWYAMAQFLIAIGVGCIFVQKSFGDPIGWLGRTTQYVAGLYLIAAVFLGAREVGVGFLKMDEILAKIFRSSFELLLEERTGQLALVNAELRSEIECRNQIEVALRDSEERFHSIFDNSLDGIFFAAPDGSIFAANHAACRMLGWTEHELCEYGRDIVMDRTDPGLTPALEERIRTGSFRGELACRRRDGLSFPVDLSSAMFKLSNGDVRTYTILRDISERRRMEDALRESEANLHRAQKISKLGSWEWDPITDRVEYTDQIFNIFGIDREHFPGSFVSLLETVVHPEDRKRVQQAGEKARETGVGQTVEYRIIRPDDGQVHWIKAIGEFIYSQGKLVKMIGANQDITEIKQAEADKAAQETLSRQLQKAESLQRMAGAVAHNFNNQLQVVIGNLEMAVDDLSPGSGVSETLAEALKAARKAATVSGMMVTYRGQTPEKHEPMDLSEACRQCLPMLQAAVPKNVVLRTDFPAPGPVILANTGMIHQILTHLVTNAWESAGENQAAIALSVKTVDPANIPASKRFPVDRQPRENAYACLEVADTGRGIAEKDIDKIFDPFFTTNFYGRGMGLSVVLGIAGVHGGGITVESEPGRGSVFRVFWPVSPETGLTPADKVEKAPEMDGRGTVLVVEDEAQVFTMIKKMLTRLGFKVLEAGDGVEAVEVFRRHRDEIRCVVTDLTMPRMNGWDTLAALRKLSPRIPVILSSGYDEAQVMAVEYPEQPNAFLGKPYRLQELKDAIRNALVNQK